MKTAAAALLLAVGFAGVAATPAWAAPPSNDNFANATPVTAPFTVTANITESTVEAGEPGQACGVSTFHTVWYAFTTPSAGTVTTDTIGSDFPAALNVYTGTSVGDLTEIACDFGSAGNNQSRVTFTAAVGTTYYIRAAGLQFSAGNLVLNGSFPIPSPPANDNFADATPVTVPFTETVNTDEATREDGEPFFTCTFATAGNTVWYALTTVSAGTVTIDSNGSDFAPELGVYTGTSVGDLTQVACSNPGQSVTFPAAASTTYYIRAAGSAIFGSPSGNLVIHGDVQPTAPDLTTTVTDSADPVALGGDDFNYTVAVANNGTATATGVSAATTLSGASATIVSASSSQGTCSISAPTVTCALGSLATSASASITVTVSPNATGTVTATAVSTLTETDANPSDNTDPETTTVNNALGCTIIGTAGNDTLNGTSGNDVLCGLGGNDTIDGKNGDDTLYGGNGDDIMGGGNGADTLYGGAGNDRNYGETLLGSLLYLFDNGNDTIYGGPGNDDLDGQNGNDTLLDTQGTDTMSGGVGNDSINVQDGTGGDTANGGLGTDTCTTDPTDTTTSC